MSKLYFSYFNNKSVYDTTIMKLSKYILPGSLDVINNYIPKESWLLGVGYSINGKQTKSTMDNIGDMQICVSGSIKKIYEDEDINDKYNIYRECCEEIGIVPKYEHLNKVSQINNIYFDYWDKYYSRVTHYVISAEHCDYITDLCKRNITEDLENYKNIPDNNNEKVVVWIYGTFERCQYLISNSTNKINSTDATLYMGLIRYDMIIKYFKKLFEITRNFKIRINKHKYIYINNDEIIYKYNNWNLNRLVQFSKNGKLF